jgi:hypothetical protein
MSFASQFFEDPLLVLFVLATGRFACPRLKKQAKVAAPSRAKRQVR